MACPCIVQSVGPLFGLMSVDSTTNVNPGSLTFPRITMISTANVGRIHDTSYDFPFTPVQPSLFVLIDMYRKQAKGSREQHNRFPFANSLTSRSASDVQAKQNAHPMKSTTRATRKDINTPVLGHKLMPSSIHSSADSCHYQQQCTKKASRREMILPCQRRLMQFRVPTSPIRPITASSPH